MQVRPGALPLPRRRRFDGPQRVSDGHGVEARIGQLLGEASRNHDRSAGAKSVMTDLASRDDRHDFRVLAHGFEARIGQLLGEPEKNSRRTGLIDVAEAEKLTGISQQQASKWGRRLTAPTA